jgi:hypothetical protein
MKGRIFSVFKDGGRFASLTNKSFPSAPSTGKVPSFPLTLQNIIHKINNSVQNTEEGDGGVFEVISSLSLFH